MTNSPLYEIFYFSVFVSMLVESLVPQLLDGLLNESVEWALGEQLREQLDGNAKLYWIDCLSRSDCLVTSRPDRFLVNHRTEMKFPLPIRTRYSYGRAGLINLVI